MRVDLKDPIQASIAMLVGSFAMFTLVLWVLNPHWVQRTDHKGNSKLSVPHLIVFSSAFSLVAAITTLLLTAQKPGRVVIDHSRFAGYYY
jgi:hypothetical protein